MDQEELALKWIEAYNAHDFAQQAALMTEDGEVMIPAMNIVQGPAWDQTGQSSARLVDDRTIEVLRMISSGDAVAIEMLWHGTSKGGPGMAPAGERVELQNCIVLTFRDSLISRYVEYIGWCQGIDLHVVRSRILESGRPTG
ncbi:nuclear transport factor 2 family protein [Umezawaea endophytica]|uniref:Nuclear transport factor 2 family protein n=1 Tax=Umezawaea endophytica TaxID=1654476 RepID=A0A9X2VX35_9PSEU|nr:nuclear transport factor 2 family protein [Umezawaea endophytica]MCS7483727.1 nuclear transport factor 2 family protein [Umezawaea endophytica]